MNYPAYQADHLLELIFKNNPMPVALMDCDFNFLRVNSAYAAADQKSPEYFVGKNHFALFPNQENQRLFTEVVKTGEPYYATAKPFEYGHNPERGVTHWDWTLVPVKQDNKLVGVMLQLVDVTLHVETEKRLTKAQNLSSIGSWEWDLVSNTVSYSEEMYHLLGITPEQYDGTYNQCLNYVHPEDRERVDAFYNTAIANIEQTICNIRHRYTRASDEIRYAHQYIEVVRDKSGKAWRVIGTFHDITEPYLAQLNLQQERNFRDTIIETANAIIVVLDNLGRIRQFNRVAEDLTFYRSEEVLGKHVWDLFLVPEEIEPVKAEFTDLKNSSLPSTYTNYWIAKDRSRILLNWNNACIRNKQGECEYVVSIGVDVTEKSALEQRHHITSLAVEKSTSAIAMASLDGKLTYINQAFLDMWGFENKSEVLGRSPLEFWKRQEEAQAVTAALLRDGKWKGELVAIKADGCEMDTLFTASITLDQDGKPVNMMASFVDVTQHRKAEADLKRNQDTLLAAQRIAHIGTWDWNIVIDELEWSDEIFEIFGMQPSSFGATYEHFLACIHPEDRTMVDEAVRASMSNSDIPYNIQYRVLRPDGEFRYVEEVGQVYRNEIGEPARMIGVVQDITEKHHNDFAIKQQAQIIDQIHDSVVSTDLDGVVTSWSKGAERIFGYTAAEVIGQNITLVYPKEEIPTLLNEVIAPLKQKGLHETEVRMQRKSGEDFYAHISLSMQRDMQGNVIGMIGYSQDISARKNAEIELASYRDQLELLVEQRTAELQKTQEELIKKERLAMLGQLTATVSHELRNPLGAIRPSLYLIKKKLEGADELTGSALERIERNIGRCDRIIDELLDFTRSGTLNKQQTFINEWLISVVAEQDIPAEIKVVTEVSETDNAVAVDRDRMRRAIVNLIQNAQHAIVDVGATSAPANEKCLHIKTISDKNLIKIIIRDTGAGIPAEVLPRIFEPLFSTKSFGVGLGMLVVKQTIEQHGGGIDIQSEVGKGTVATLWLPLRADKDVAA